MEAEKCALVGQADYLLENRGWIREEEWEDQTAIFRELLVAALQTVEPKGPGRVYPCPYCPCNSVNQF
jgi:hypothetical protein